MMRMSRLATLSRMGPWWARSKAQLSREGRDTLWLLAVLTSTMVMHWPRLPWWASAGAVLAVGWRARLAWRDGPLPPRSYLLIGLAVSMALTVGTFHTLFGREAGVTLVTLLASLKTLELRARRDAFVVTSLGFFLILTQFLYSQSPLVALAMLLSFIGLLTSLVLAQRPLGRPSVLSATGMACRSLLMGLPVMLALYVLFPRLGPLWSVPADAQHHTGLTDRIELGKLAELAMDDSVAMRVQFDGPPPAKPDLYFRGPVLDIYDGQTWSMHPAGVINWPEAQEQVWPLPLQPTGPTAAAPQRLAYLVTLEATHTQVLPLLEGTVVAMPAAPYTEPQLSRQGLSWRSANPLQDRAQIQAEAWRHAGSGDPGRPPSPLTSLQLPDGSNPRTRQWAQAWRHAQQLDAADGLSLTRALLTHIRQQNYRYSLSTEGDGNPIPHPIDQFWLDRRVGFCEHFATAFVFIMRSWGVPSRVVTGFQGAELNPVDGWYVVRNSDAHAWAEIWQPGQGWLRVDPTAAVAPERIDKPRSAQRQRQGLGSPLSALNPQTWGLLRDYLDAGNHRWNTWVLQYSRNRQLDLLRDWGFSSPDWMDLLRLCAGMLSSLAMAGLLWLWWTRPKQQHNPWHRPMMRVNRALQPLGLTPQTLPPPWPALAWAESLQSWQPVYKTHDKGGNWRQLRDELVRALRQLDAWRYGPAAPDARQQRRQVISTVAQIESMAKTLRKLRA
jgi:transglutaminase-like putative cysteine protease